MSQNSQNQTQTQQVGQENTEYSPNILESVSKIGRVVNNLIIQNKGLILDPFERSMIEGDLQRILIRAYGIDKIFGHIDTDSESMEKFSNLISIVVYNNEGHVIYLNDAYLRATGLESKEQIIELSKKGLLYDEIYEGECLENVNKKVGTLENEQSWGYMNETFKMKRTGRVLRWNTLKFNQKDNKTHNQLPAGNARVGIDVTNIKGYESLLNFERGPRVNQFNFAQTVERFRNTFFSILNNNPELKNKTTPEDGRNFMEGLKKLEEVAPIGDIIVNWGPLLVYMKHDNELFLNRRFYDVAGYTEKDDGQKINALLCQEESFWKRMFGDEIIYKELYEGGNETRKNIVGNSTLTRKDEIKVDILRNAIKINSIGSSVWIGTMMSPLMEEKITKKEEVEEVEMEVTGKRFGGFDWDKEEGV